MLTDVNYLSKIKQVIAYPRTMPVCGLIHRNGVLIPGIAKIRLAPLVIQSDLFAVLVSCHNSHAGQTRHDGTRTGNEPEGRSSSPSRRNTYVRSSYKDWMASVAPESWQKL